MQNIHPEQLNMKLASFRNFIEHGLSTGGSVFSTASPRRDDQSTHNSQIAIVLISAIAAAVITIGCAKPPDEQTLATDFARRHSHLSELADMIAGDSVSLGLGSVFRTAYHARDQTGIYTEYSDLRPGGPLSPKRWAHYQELLLAVGNAISVSASPKCVHVSVVSSGFLGHGTIKGYLYCPGGRSSLPATDDQTKWTFSQLASAGWYVFRRDSQ